LTSAAASARRERIHSSGASSRDSSIAAGSKSSPSRVRTKRVAFQIVLPNAR
jgi:hypothetical protein